MPYKSKEDEKEYNQKYYALYKERIKAGRRKYYRNNVAKCLACSIKANLSEETKRRGLLRQTESRKRFPMKHRARKMVYRAVKAGKLVRGPCEICGHTKVEAHHSDYTKALEIRWLCRRCHMIVEGRSINLG